MDNSEQNWREPGKVNLRENKSGTLYKNEEREEKIGDQEAAESQVEVTGEVNNQSSPVEEDSPQPVVIRPEPERTLLTWRSPSRIYKQRNREFWVTIGALAITFGGILFLIDGFMPVVLIIAFIFFVYVMSNVPPDELEYSITTRGIVYSGRTHRWGEMVRFWFEERWGQKVLLADTVTLPGRMQILLGGKNEEEVREAMKLYVIEEKPKEVWTDRVVKWINRKVPLDVS